MHGSAAPDAVVELQVAERSWTTRADAAGAWSTVLDELGAGIHTIEARQSDAAGTVSAAATVEVEISGPPSLVIDLSGREWMLRVTGAPGADVLLTLSNGRSTTLTLDASGVAEFGGRPWARALPAPHVALPLLSGATVRHVVGDRTGPAGTALIAPASGPSEEPGHEVG
ncbi:Ig-like domain-containing protein [Agromyces archimandritae]|uniref:Ig-like domain-containing protein n=1 Tax=Agromyces archimandritae TaxID=2781962 RepID=UPI001FCF91A0|nr:Ig-like domain-containing protein [Agromyces archimandritae]